MHILLLRIILTCKWKAGVAAKKSKNRAFHATDSALNCHPSYGLEAEPKLRQQAQEMRIMKATIWHNPKCGTSRKTKAILEEAPGVELEVVEYLKAPPTRDKLAQLFADAGMSPNEGLRLRGTDAAERGLPDASADAVLDAMAAEPILINRPLVETEKGVKLCRPQDEVHALL
jgi:arsenate reductase